jgi:hypothetical protein
MTIAEWETLMNAARAKEFLARGAYFSSLDFAVAVARR